MAQETKKMNKVNGVDLSALRDTIGAIQDNPHLAKFKFRATNEWLTCGNNRTKIKGFYGAEQEFTHPKAFSLEADEPEVLLGGGKAPGPADYVLTALASCMATSVAYHAAAKGIRVERVEAELEGNVDLRGFLGLSGEVPKGFQDITVTMKIKSDATRDELEELANMSPVADTLRRPVPVNVKIETE